MHPHPPSFLKHIFSMHSGLGTVREGEDYREHGNKDTASQDITNTPERSPRVSCPKPSYAVCDEGLGHMDQEKGCF